jgi:site-specific DNA-methyltransferase (adenine-specific)
MTIDLRCGDALALMREMESGSVDAVVTDPPYGLRFMGKEWDHGIPGIPFWTEALRVAKPGAHLLAFGGTRTFHRLTCAIEDAGWEIRDCLMWLYGSGFPKSHNLDGEHDGWGTALKPAWEPIIMARKPLIGTVAANVAQYGTGALNVDGCRVEAIGRPAIESKSEDSLNTFGNGLNGSCSIGSTDLGRWPANVVHDGSEEVVERFPVDESKATKPRPFSRTVDYKGLSENGGAFAIKSGHVPSMVDRGDSGSASRFFYCAKASRSERGEGNNHPTVKPVALMQWLCRLVTPPAGVILDPFMGSGSTGIAADREGFSFIGFDLSPEYVEIARRRIAADAPLFNEVQG